MTRSSEASVRTLLLLLVFACLGPGITGAVMLFIHQYQEGRSQQERNTIQTARALVQAVDSHLLRVRAVGETLALESSLAQGDMESFHAHARQVVKTSGLAANVVLRDKDEQLVLNALEEFGAALPRQPSREHVLRVFSTGKPAISGPYRVPQFSQPIISVDVPVVVRGQVAYSLGISVFPEHLNAILKSQNLHSGWVAAVLDGTGTVAARNISPEKFVGNKATPSLLRALTTSGEGTSESISLEGNAVQTSFSHSPTTNWAVAIGIPTKSLQEAMMISLARLAAGLALLFIAGLVLAWSMGGRIAHSFRALTVSATALGRGESVQAPHVHVKEAAEVGSALVNAAQLLRQHTKELQAREAELAQAHTRLRDVIDSSPALIYLKDMQGKFLIVNKSYENLMGKTFPGTGTGLDAGASTGTGIKASEQGYLPQGEGPSIADLEVLGNGQAIQFEEKIETADGVKFFAVSKAPLRSHEGQMIGICAAAVDITSLKMAEAQVLELVTTLEKRVEQRTEELRVANAQLLSVNGQLTDANSQLEAFSYTVAHDLRAPLRGIQGFADALAEDYAGVVDATGNDYLQRISRAAGRMEQLIDDLLSFSRLARMELPLGPVSLDDVFQQVLLNVGPQIRAGNAVVRIEPQLPHVHANRTACLQVFQNLVSNALKFARKEVPASITIRADTGRVEHKPSGLVRIWVEDNGIGVPADQQERIFRPFERLNGMSEYQGSGIGLAIVDKAVSRMQGRCGVESAPGAGSRFWVELPALTREG
jgi:signal transduction histidine kinase